MSFSNTSLEEGEMALHHIDGVPYSHIVAQTVHNLLKPNTYTVKPGDTLQKVADALGIMVPVSLFSVKEGQVWSIIGNFMVNSAS